MRLIAMAVAMLVPMVQPRMAHGQATDAERIVQLQQENERLRRELEAATLRLQQLESQQGTVTPPPRPAGSRDPGTDPWGNPNAVFRSLAAKFRESMQEKGQAIPGPDADAKLIASYRKVAGKWIESMHRFDQAISWRVHVSECVQVNSQPRELEFVAHVLRPDGSRVEPAFTFRCAATTVGDLVPRKATGDWLLQGKVVPMLELQPEGTAESRGNPFGPAPTIAPWVEARLRYVVKSLKSEPSTAP
jgi:hypothetical protein